MFKNKRFLTFVIIFSIFMGGAFATSALIISSELIKNKQLQQKALIEQLLVSNLTDDAKVLSRQLRASVDFEHLTITDTSNNVLYRYIKDHSKRPTLSFLLKKAELYTPIQRLKSSQGKLIIEFQSSYQQILIPLTLIVVIAGFAPMMLTMMIYLVAELVQDKRQSKLVKVFEDYLSKRTLPKDNPSELEPFLPLLDKLKSSDYDVANEQDNDVKFDKLTGLATGPEFVHFYQSKIKVSGKFFLFRAKNLQQINFEQGYAIGDKYIQLLAKGIWQSISMSEDCHLYKLNGLDFGVLLFDNQLSSEQLVKQTLDNCNALLEQANISAEIAWAELEFNPSTPLEQLLENADQQAA